MCVCVCALCVWVCAHECVCACAYVCARQRGEDQARLQWSSPFFFLLDSACGTVADSLGPRPFDVHTHTHTYTYIYTHVHNAPTNKYTHTHESAMEQTSMVRAAPLQGRQRQPRRLHAGQDTGQRTGRQQARRGEAPPSLPSHLLSAPRCLMCARAGRWRRPRHRRRQSGRTPRSQQAPLGCAPRPPLRLHPPLPCPRPPLPCPHPPLLRPLLRLLRRPLPLPPLPPRGPRQLQPWPLRPRRWPRQSLLRSPRWPRAGTQSAGTASP